MRRDLAARPGRQAMVMGTVIIAVTFTTAAFGLSSRLSSLLSPASTTQALASTPRGSVVIQADSGDLTTRTALDQSLVGMVSAQPGVATANGGYDQPVSFKVSSAAGLGRPPLFRGLLLSSTFDRAVWQITSGRAPSGPDEVALDAPGLIVADSQLGSTPQLELPTGARDVQVVGIVAPVSGPSQSVGSADLAPTDLAAAASIAIASAHVVLDPEVAPQLLDAVGRLDQITALPLPGVDPDDLARRLKSALPGSLRITAAASRAAATQATIGSIDDGIQTATLIEAALTALVAALVVANLFSVLTAQRTRELGLLRALGAGRHQITRTVVIEAMLVGVVSTVLGGIAGGFLGAAAARFVQPADASPTFVSTPTMWAAAAIVGIGVTLAGSVAPAVRAGRVSPLEALSEAGAGGERRTRLLPGVIALINGGAAVAWAIATTAPSTAFRNVVAGVGAASIIWGLGRCSRAALGPLFDLLARRSGRRDVTSRLAFGNLSRHPTRTAAAASTLMIGLALVGAVATVGATARTSIDAQLRTSGSAQVIVQRRGLVRVSTDSIVGALRNVRGISDLAELQTVDGSISGRSGNQPQVTATNFDAMASIVDLGIVERSAAGTAPTGDAAMLSTNAADALGTRVGESVTLTSASGRNRSVRVVALYQNTAIVGPAVVTREAARAVGASGSFELAAVRVNDRAPFDRVVNRIDRIARSFPKVGVNTPDELAKLDGGIADSAIRVVAILLIGAVGLGFGGLAGTLALSTLERRRELVLLRAIGSTRAQLRRSISIEAGAVAAIAAAVGLAGGCGAAWIGLSSATSAFSGAPVVPVGAIAVIALGAIACAWVVSLAVSQRASKVQPSEAGRLS